MPTSQYFNRCSFGAAGAGTASFVVATSPVGFHTPAAAGVPDGALVSYFAINPESSHPTEWETGQGTYSQGTTTLARTTIRESSNSNAIVNFSAPPIVYLDAQAQDLAFVFTSTASGLVPASGGGTTNFLRADGTFAAPGGGGTPGSPTTSVQTNQGGVFTGDAVFVWNQTNHLLGVGTSGLTFTGFNTQMTVATNTNNNWLTRFASYGGGGFSTINIYSQTRGTTGPDVHAAVQSGDGLLENRMYASDGTNFINCATMHFDVLGTVSAGIVPVTFTMRMMDAGGSYQTRLFVSGGGQWQFINNDSNNTSIPLAAVRHTGTLTAGAGAGYQFQVQSPNSGVVTTGQIDSIFTTVGLNADVADMRFSTLNTGVGNITEKMRIDGPGNVTIAAAGHAAITGYPEGTPQFQLQSTVNQGSIGTFTSWNTVDGNPTLVLAYANSGAIGTHGAPLNNQWLGDISFEGSDGTQFIQGAIINAQVEGTITAGHVPTRITFQTSSASITTEAARIDSAQRLLIGGFGTAPAGAVGNLQLHGTTSATFSTEAIGRWSADAIGGNFNFYKSRGAAVGTQTITAQNDVIGTVNFFASDGTNFIGSSAISGIVDGTPTSGIAFGALSFQVNDGGGGYFEVMKLDNAGELFLHGDFPRVIIGGGGIPGGVTQVFGSALQVLGTNGASGTGYIGRATNGSGNVAPRLFFAFSHSTSFNGHTAVASGNYLGELGFQGDDGTSFTIDGVRISAIVNGTVATGAIPTDLSFQTSPGAAGLTERVRFDNQGQLIHFGQGVNGQSLNIQAITELTTIAAAATTTTGIQIPANAVVFGVDVRVTVAIPTAATFTVTATTPATTFNTAAVSTAANSTDPGTKTPMVYFATAQGIVITPNLTPATNAGRVRTTIHYYTITPATS